MAFELIEKTKMRIVGVTPRREKHGAEKVPAMSGKMRVEASNALLSMFDGFLLHALYGKNGVDPAQGDLAGVEPVSDLPNLRFPHLEQPLKWDTIQNGMQLSLDVGTRKPLVLSDLTVDEFAFTCKEGGTTIIEFRWASNTIDELQAGKLAMRVDREVDGYLTRTESVQKTLDEVEQGQPAAGEPERGENWPFPRDETAAGETPEPVGDTEPPQAETKPRKRGTKAEEPATPEATISATDAFLAAAGESA